MLKNKNLLMITACVILAFVTLIRIVITWKSYGQLNIVSGIWISLAHELSHGIFYRPLQGPLGFGGIRYAPFHFVIHAMLIPLFGDPVRAGFGVTFLSVGALVLSIYYLLRAWKIQKETALFAAFISLGCACVQWGVSNIRGDLLPAALNLWGMMFFSRALYKESPRKNLFISGVLFVLCFFTKVTTLSGISAAVTLCLYQSRKKMAAELCFIFGLGTLFLLGIVQWLSSGAFFEVFLSSARVGTSFYEVFRSPITLTHTLIFGEPLIVQVLLLALVGRKVGSFKVNTSLPWVFFLLNLSMTIGIFGSAGVTSNHCVDLYIAALLAVVVMVEGRVLPYFTYDLISVGVFVSIFHMTWGLFGMDNRPMKSMMNSVLTEVKANTPVTFSKQPILSDNPLINVLDGQYPYLMDFYAFVRSNPPGSPRAEQLEEDFRTHRFRAVVVSFDLSTPLGQNWMGPLILNGILKNYSLGKQLGDFFIYYPKL
jgi:hypothetical protein